MAIVPLHRPTGPDVQADTYGPYAPSRAITGAARRAALVRSKQERRRGHGRVGASRIRHIFMALLDPDISDNAPGRRAVSSRIRGTRRRSAAWTGGRGGECVVSRQRVEEAGPGKTEQEEEGPEEGPGNQQTCHLWWQPDPWDTNRISKMSLRRMGERLGIMSWRHSVEAICLPAVRKEQGDHRRDERGRARGFRKLGGARLDFKGDNVKPWRCEM